MSEEKPERQLHPCQYCETLCYGSQCKNCHLKMIADKHSNCVDCNVYLMQEEKMVLLERDVLIVKKNII